MKSILIFHPGRCGSHWLLYMLKRLTGLDTLPAEPETPPLAGHIWGTRERYKDVERLKGRLHVIFLLRDPRDVETSLRLYRLGPRTREADSILHRMTWYRWYLAHHQGAHTVRYEDMVEDTQAAMQALLAGMSLEYSTDQIAAVVEAESFEARTGRPRGVEDQSDHLRKGIVGDWRNHWSPEKAAKFEGRFEKELEQLGYL